jgi:hypothetical protein
MVGAKLRDNNPAITDLNDPNRPMKIGEQFSGVYENEWTDAFLNLEDMKSDVNESACINEVPLHLTQYFKGEYIFTQGCIHLYFCKRSNY